MLKKCLLGFFVGFVGFIGFSNALTFTIDCTVTTSNKSIGFSFADRWNNTFDYTKCIKISDDFIQFLPSGNSYRQIRTMVSRGSSSSLLIPYFGKFNGIEYTGIVCGIPEGNTYLELYVTNTQGSDICNNSGGVIEYEIIDFPFSSGCPECQECPEIDTGAILSGACDTNYCVQNDLCPSSSGSRSELMINNIVHEGKPLISINIPDNIYWDYATDDNQFDLYVGSGYNQDYIDSVLAINSYRPDNQDFTNIFVSGLTLIFPYIFVALLIVFIWKLLKRIFK